MKHLQLILLASSLVLLSTSAFADDTHTTSPGAPATTSAPPVGVPAPPASAETATPESAQTSDKDYWTGRLRNLEVQECARTAGLSLAAKEYRYGAKYSALYKRCQESNKAKTFTDAQIAAAPQAVERAFVVDYIRSRKSEDCRKQLPKFTSFYPSWGIVNEAERDCDKAADAQVPSDQEVASEALASLRAGHQWSIRKEKFDACVKSASGATAKEKLFAAKKCSDDVEKYVPSVPELRARKELNEKNSIKREAQYFLHDKCMKEKAPTGSTSEVAFKARQDCKTIFEKDPSADDLAAATVRREDKNAKNSYRNWETQKCVDAEGVKPKDKKYYDVRANCSSRSEKVEPSAAALQTEKTYLASKREVENKRYDCLLDNVDKLDKRAQCRETARKALRELKRK